MKSPSSEVPWFAGLVWVSRLVLVSGLLRLEDEGKCEDVGSASICSVNIYFEKRGTKQMGSGWIGEEVGSS